MSKKQSKQGFFSTLYVTHFFVFFIGCISMYLCLTYLNTPTQKESSFVVRKPTKSKFIAPLLLGSESSIFYEDESFSKQINSYTDNVLHNKKALAISVYFKNLTTGSWVGINENDHYAPASLMKVPIMLAIFKQAEQDPTFLKKELYYDGSSDLNREEYYKPQEKILPHHSYSIEKLLDYMITYSDNNATVLLLSVTPKTALTEIFTDLGLPVPDDTTTGTIDYMSDKLYSRLFRVLYNSTYLNEEYSEKALKILANPDFPNGIAHSLPSGISVANKFGERTIYNEDKTIRYRELHDCGIIYVPKSPYLLCIMTKGNDFKALETVIQDISTMTYARMK